MQQKKYTKCRKPLELQGGKCTITYPMYRGERTSMWKLIPQMMFPPTRIQRYCCRILKEAHGANRMITTGVRWDESVKRKNRGIYETIGTTVADKIILPNDNDDRRQLFENCRLKAKRVCNPIVDWLDHDVWDFIRSEHLDVNPLYQCGFGRVGCVGCPMAGKNRYFDFRVFPKYEMMYRHAFARMLDARVAAGKPNDAWENPDSLFQWWMQEDPDQITFDELILEDVP